MVKKSLLWMYRLTLFLVWLTVFIIAGTVIGLRYVVLPNLDHYKEKITAEVSHAIGQKIAIADIKANWDGLNPHFILSGLEVYDNQNRSALSLNHVETSLSWLSIPLLEPRLASITILKPELTIRREQDGTVFVAGISMNGPSRPAFPNWLLKQSQIDVIDASIVWQDDLRHAPPLALNNLRLQLISPAWESLIGHHRFGLRATPSAGSSQPLDIRGNFYGKDVAQWQDWHGTLYSKVEGTDLAAWRQWFKYPVDLKQGYGASRVWVEFSHGKPEKIVGDVLMNQVKTTIPRTQHEATLNLLSGRFEWYAHEDGQEVRAKNIKIRDHNGLDMRNGTFSLREHVLKNKTYVDGNLALDEIELSLLDSYLNLFPLEDPAKQTIRNLAPRGLIKNLEFSWNGDQSVKPDYSLRGQFIKLGINAYEEIPGFINLSGSVDANASNGSLTISAQDASLDFASVMRWPIPATRLSGQVKWLNKNRETEVRVSNLAILNPHLTGNLNATYWHTTGQSGKIDLTGKFSNVDAKYGHYYYPKLLGKDTLNWLDTAIIDGHGEDVNLTLKGNLHDFPYDKTKNGLFRVTAKVTNGVLDYAAGWPKIDNIKLDMLFEGDRMELNATQGNLLGNKIVKAKVSIPVLSSPHNELEVVGETVGPVSEGFKYINTSPLVNVMRGFTEGIQTTGDGKLNLDLHIPLHDIDSTKVKGAYQITNGSLSNENIPELTKVNGKIEFTESTLKGQNIGAWAFGGPSAINLSTGKDHVIHVAARGHATDAGLKQWAGNQFGSFADRLTGSLDWYANINILDKQLDISVNSTLVGLTSSLPAPLNKTSTEALPLKFEKHQSNPNQDSIVASVGNALSAKLLRTNQQGTLKLERGDIALNLPAEMPSQAGISFRASMDYLDVDEWRNLFDASNASKSNGANGGIGLNKIELSANSMDVFDRRVTNLKLLAKPANNGWTLNIQSKEIVGDAIWTSPTTPQDNGKLSARLKLLIIPTAAPSTTELRTQGNFKQQAQEYPALDIVADNFEYGKKKLGHLEIIASEQNDDWSIEKLRIVNPESTLNAEGEWHNWKHNPNTRMTIAWTINDLGKTLDRFGYPNTVKGGDGNLSGQLKWPGSPHEFDTLGLSGNLLVDARKGQILKIQPGVGRLFSVLSLQNLPRRLTFDFRDVFSSGFTFDKIGASVRIDRGIMHSDDFKMEGPTARVEMRGDTDLQKETQHLYVKVTPYISDSLSIAALAGGPVAGAAAFVAQKLLKDPINKLAADEYEITGTWDNPQEIKSGDNKP